MSNALKKNLVTERLVQSYASQDQRERFEEGVLPYEEFLESAVRPMVFAIIDEYKSMRRLRSGDYGVDDKSFKVLEVPHGDTSLTAEQFAALKQLRSLCARAPQLENLSVTMTCTLLEKHVIANDKLVDKIPFALVEVTIGDPQGRCEPFVIRRRVDL